MSETIGKRILRLRLEKDMKQKELCDAVGITEATLSRYENDLRSPKGEIVAKLAAVLGTRTDYILGNTDNKFDNDILFQEIPEEFTDASEARFYIQQHKIFASEGFNVNKLSDDEVLEFANALLEQMLMVSYKYKK